MKAMIISYNWETQEMKKTLFVGKKEVEMSENEGRLLIKDFNEKTGWKITRICDKEASDFISSLRLGMTESEYKRVFKKELGGNNGK